ncbi:winged helix-turn-helix transcriptional regulator [Alicyclobacillus sp. TC]|uniref:ArsR/SmtB family transcription factor n=1 Tax=Alicyclobacillus sp. TC TaxID=2606450 RepID=UPI0019341153|nr:metalloregulator ArsR/SmtB family transcription factor [Alicyclobacillus sp. TC]QRF22826.1 winged helix-turn-helix transcriptional regulator [Alicyclobacillus sp. TC]
MICDAHDVFKALSDPNRLRIIQGLSTRCQSVNEISETVGMSQPLTSHHLKALRRAGIVRQEICATSRYYCLSNEIILDMVRLCHEFISRDISKKGIYCSEQEVIQQ